MPAATARVYFDHIGEDILRWRHELQQLARNVFSAMRLLLNSIDYLSPATKERINAKLDSVKVTPAIPSWIMDEERVLKDAGHYNESESLLSNDFRRQRESFLVELKKLTNFDDEDPPPTMEFNSDYDARILTITMYLGNKSLFRLLLAHVVFFRISFAAGV